MTKNILESIVLIAAAAAFTIMLTWPKYQEFETQNALVTQQRTDLETRQEYFKNLQETAAELNNYGPNLAKIESALPDDARAATLVNFLELSAMQDGLVLKAIDYTGENQKSSAVNAVAGKPAQKVLKQMHLTFTLFGPYASWQSFIFGVEKSSRMIEIETVQISGNQSKGSQISVAGQQGYLDYIVKLTAHYY